MAEIVLDRDYRCAPEGHTTFVFLRGQRVTGKVAEMAQRDGYAVKPRAPRKTKPAAPQEAKTCSAPSAPTDTIAGTDA